MKKNRFAFFSWVLDKSHMPLVDSAGPPSREHEGGFTRSMPSAEHGFTHSRRSAEHGFTHSRRSAEHGFTLIELLVAMMASMVLLILLSGVVTTLGREVGREPRTSADREVDALRPTLSSLIRHARNDGHDVVEVTPDRLRFVSSPPEALGPVGPVEVQLEVERSGRDHYLAGTLTPIAALAPAPARTFRSATGFDQIAFSTVEARAPNAVRLEFVKGGRTRAIVAAPGVNQSADCIFDPISMACR